MSLTDKLLVVELLLLVALSFGLLLWLGYLRVPLVATGKVHPRTIALSRDGWPSKVQQVANAVDNQFQLPVLFYAAVLLTLALGGAGWLEVILGGVFVALRYVHALIHITDNNVPRRFFAYSAGFVVLIAYWLGLAVRVVLA